MQEDKGGGCISLLTALTSEYIWLWYTFEKVELRSAAVLGREPLTGTDKTLYWKLVCSLSNSYWRWGGCSFTNWKFMSIILLKRMFLAYELWDLSKAPLLLAIPWVSLNEAAELEFKLR